MNSFWWEFICCNEYWDYLLRKYVNIVFCVLLRNVKCDLKNAIQICFLQKLFEMIHFRDHAWSFHRQFFFDRLISSFDEWRMLILDYRVTYVCSRSVEWRFWWDVKLDEASHQTWNEATHQTWKRLIKLDESDSSNLTRKTSFHQIWRKRHFIKSDENFISSNFEKEEQSLYFLINDLVHQHMIWRT
jgi:hypothetical protein